MPSGIYIHKPHLEATKIKIGVSNSGKNGSNWKGNNVGYHGIHTWLKKNYGNADKCENSKCEYENPKRYDWALLRGFKYERRRENFSMFCRGCHLKYDLTEKKRLKMRRYSKKMKRNNGGKFLKPTRKHLD